MDPSLRFDILLLAEEPSRLREDRFFEYHIEKTVAIQPSTSDPSFKIPDLRMESTDRLGTLRSHQLMGRHNVMIPSHSQNHLNLTRDSHISCHQKTSPVKTFTHTGNATALVKKDTRYGNFKKSTSGHGDRMLISTSSGPSCPVRVHGTSFSNSHFNHAPALNAGKPSVTANSMAPLTVPNGELDSGPKDQQKNGFHQLLAYPRANDNRLIKRKSQDAISEKQSNDSFHSNQKSYSPHHQSRPYTRRIITTKLRHFAKTTSPNAVVLSPGKRIPFGSSPCVIPSSHHVIQRPSSLIVSISLLLIKRPSSAVPYVRALSRETSLSISPFSRSISTDDEVKKGRHKVKPKPTTLSTFAMKKRAASPTYSPPPEIALTELPQAKRTKLDYRGMVCSNLLPSIQCSLPSPSKDPTGEMVYALNTNSKVECQPSRDHMEGNSQLLYYYQQPQNVVTESVGRKTQSADDHPAENKQASSYNSFDETNHNSISSTGIQTVSNPTFSSKHLRGTEVIQRLPSSRIEGTIQFDNFFKYYPPKLVVLDGELCPEHSLSVGDLDKTKLNSLPQTHPFWNWNLGMPTSKRPPSPPNKVRRRKYKSKANANSI